MADPQFQASSVSSGTSGTTSTTHSVTLPASVASGDLLFLFVICSDENNLISVDGWTALTPSGVDNGGEGGFFQPFYKVAGSSESGPTITLDISDTCSWVCLRIYNGIYDDRSEYTLGTGTAPNSGTPPSPTTSDNFYQLAVAFWMGDTSVSSSPSSYSVGNAVSNDSTPQDHGIATALRLVSSVEDPGAYTLADSVKHGAVTITVLGGDIAGGSGSVAADGDITGVGEAEHGGSGSIAADGDIGGSGHAANGGSGDIDATGSMSGTGDAGAGGSGSITATGTTTGAGSAAKGGSGSVDADGTLSGTGSAGTGGAGSITADGTLSGTGSATHSGAGSIDSTGALSGTGEAPGGIPSGSGSVDATGTSSGTGYRSSSGSGTVDTTGEASGTGPTTPSSGGGSKHMKCCCPTECVVYTDDFNRADGSLGADWTASGTAAIDSNTAKITSGTIKYAQEVVDPQGAFVATFETINSLDGDIYDFHVWDSSGNVLLTARFQADDTSGNWIISLRQGAGAWYADNVEMISGCGTYQEPFLAGRSFTVSYDRNIFRVGGTTPEQPHYELWQCYDVGADVAKVGFGHGGGPRAIWIDNFELSDHYVHNTSCPYPGCLCGNGSSRCWPDTFSLQITNPSDCYVQLPSTSTITLNQVYRSQTLWISGKVLPCYGCTTATTFYVQFFFWCEYSPGEPGFRLAWCTESTSTTADCDLCETHYEWDFVSRDADCDLFDMIFEFGPWDTACKKAVDDCDPGFPTCDPLIAEVTE